MYYPTFSRRGLKAKTKAAYARITLNRHTTAFFVFSFIYCVTQGLVQSLLFSTDQEYSTLVAGLVRGGAIPVQNMTFLDSSKNDLILHMCTDIPVGTFFPCFTIFNSTEEPASANPVRRSLGAWQQGMMINPIPDPLNSSLVIGVDVTPPGAQQPVTLDEQCLRTLVYSSQIFDNFIREDITWVCLQFWLLVISFLAILNDSVPHVLAVLMTRAISTAWAAYALWRGGAFKNNFDAIYASPASPCNLEVFDPFFAGRKNFEIVDFLLSCTGIIFFSYLSWTLLKTYNEHSFKCVGAPAHIMRINKFFMALLACLQLEVFVLTAGMGLWINVLTTTSIRDISAHTHLYRAAYISSVILLLPWIIIGWYSIRREMRHLMILFIAVGLVILSEWSAMFSSQVFRWTFMQWPYLGCFTVASLILLTASLVLGVVCRINFGKGLAEYLHAESTLASLNFAPAEFEHRSARNSKDSAASSFGNASSSETGHDDFMTAPPMFFVVKDDALAPDAGRGEMPVPTYAYGRVDGGPGSRVDVVIWAEKDTRRGPVPF